MKMHGFGKFRCVKYLMISFLFLMIANVEASDLEIESPQPQHAIAKIDKSASLTQPSQLSPYRLSSPHSYAILASDILYKEDKKEGLQKQPSDLKDLKNHNSSKIRENRALHF